MPIRFPYLCSMRIVGRKPVLELLQSGKPVDKVRVVLGTQGRIVGEIIAEAKKRGIRVDRVNSEVARRTFGNSNHQGVVAEASPIQFYSLSDLDKKIPVRHNTLVALDGVTDPHHLGAVARSALGSGCDALILPARRSAPITDTALKASAGTLNRLPVIRVGNLSDTIIQLKKDGWWVHGAAGEGSKILWDHEWDKRNLVLIGSEGDGLSQRVRKLCDFLVQIPLESKVESLSVSAATSVILFDLYRKKRS